MLSFLLFMSVKPIQDSAIPDFFVGVDAVSDNVEDIKNLVNEVKSYTNLFVIGSIGITFNVMKLEDVCRKSMKVDSTSWFSRFQQLFFPSLNGSSMLGKDGATVSWDCTRTTRQEDAK